MHHVFAIMIGLIAVVGLLLAALHGMEAALWAAAYWWLGAINLPGEAILYSVDSISTRGASGLMLERHWRTLRRFTLSIRTRILTVAKAMNAMPVA